MEVTKVLLDPSVLAMLCLEQGLKNVPSQGAVLQLVLLNNQVYSEEESELPRQFAVFCGYSRDILRMAKLCRVASQNPACSEFITHWYLAQLPKPLGAYSAFDQWCVSERGRAPHLRIPLDGGRCQRLPPLTLLRRWLNEKVKTGDNWMLITVSVMLCHHCHARSTHVFV